MSGRLILGAFRFTGVAVGVGLLVSWQLQPVPLLLKLLPAGILAASLIRPSWGLLSLAGLGPVVGALSVSLQSPFRPSRAFEQLVLAALVGAGLSLWRRGAALRLTAPGLVLAVVALASAAAVQPALLMQQMPGVTAREHVRTFFAGGYFQRVALTAPTALALMTAEGVAVGMVAERVVRTDTELPLALVRMTVFGYAGLGLITFARILGASLHTDIVWESIVRIVAHVRVSLLEDLNAAGSVFAMVFVSGMAVITSSRRLRWPMVTALAVVGFGLWLTGSRAALAALGVVLISLLSIEAARSTGAKRWLIATAVIGSLGFGAWTLVRYPASRNAPLVQAAEVRVIMARVSLRMWVHAPMFGVGIGRFYAESSNFGTDALGTASYAASNENAHNNFLQVLAEEGLLGLIALLTTLVVVIGPAAREAATSSSRPKTFLIAGLVAFVLTWLAGHPLLTAEPTVTFWLLVGVLAGMTVTPGDGRWRALAPIGALLLVLTAPIRADWVIRQTAFEHLGVGLTEWQPALDGVRYREAGTTFALYLPADGTTVLLPMRRAPEAPDPLDVRASVGGRTFTTVRLVGDGWQLIQLQPPRANRQFELVDFTVSGLTSTSKRLVQVGKEERRLP